MVCLFRFRAEVFVVCLCLAAEELLVVAVQRPHFAGGSVQQVRETQLVSVFLMLFCIITGSLKCYMV